MGAAELRAVLGHEVWKVSLEAGEYAQSEICVLEIQAPEINLLKEKRFPFPGNANAGCKLFYH